MTQQLPDQIDDVLEHWKSTRGNKIGLTDISQLIDALNMLTAWHLCQRMAAKNMTIDQMNQHLNKHMAASVKQGTELLAEIAALMDTPDAPSHRRQ